MNRQQRRAANKAKPAWARESKDEIVRRLVKNGITPDDLEAEYKRGYNAGNSEASEFAVKMTYCGFALALKREFGFGQQRIIRMLRSADQIILHELTTQEIIDRVAHELGIEVRFSGEQGSDLFDI